MLVVYSARLLHGDKKKETSACTTTRNKHASNELMGESSPGAQVRVRSNKSPNYIYLISREVARPRSPETAARW